MVGVLATLLLPLHASAQPNYQAAPAPVVTNALPSLERTGFTFGASIGRGNIDMACEGCGNLPSLEEALSYSVHGGYMLAPRLALVGEFWDVRYNDRNSSFFTDSNDHVVSQQMVTVGAQLWLLKSLWLRAGIGSARHISDSQFSKRRGFPGGRVPAASGDSSSGQTEPDPGRVSAWAPSAVAAVGWEFVHTRTFAVDVQVRAANSRMDGGDYNVRNLAVVFGANWY
jgi:hypothetical protein